MVSAADTVDISRQNMEAFLKKAADVTTGKSSADGHSDILGLQENMEGLKKVAGSFEAIFTQMLFKEMRKTVHDKEGILPSSSTQSMFQEMLDGELSNNISGSLGIADAVVRSYGKYVGNHVNKIA